MQKNRVPSGSFVVNNSQRIRSVKRIHYFVSIAYITPTVKIKGLLFLNMYENGEEEKLPPHLVSCSVLPKNMISDMDARMLAGKLRVFKEKALSYVGNA